MESSASSPALKTSRLVIVGAAAAAVAGLVVLYVFDPATSSFYPRCVFRALTGFLCPGCGITRAAHHLLHGRVIEAFHYNAMAVALGPFLLAGAFFPRFVLKPWIGWTVVTVLISWGVMRNLV